MEVLSQTSARSGAVGDHSSAGVSVPPSMVTGAAVPAGSSSRTLPLSVLRARRSVPQSIAVATPLVDTPSGNSTTFGIVLGSVGGAAGPGRRGGAGAGPAGGGAGAPAS